MILRALLFATVSLVGSSAYSATIHLGDKIFLEDLGVGVKPTAINRKNQVVGQYSDGNAFLWQDGSFTTLGTLGGLQTHPNDINDNGVVVGWSLDAEGVQKPFRYGVLPNTMENLEQEFGLSGAVEAININGVAVGWVSNGTDFTRSIRWWDESPEGEFLFAGKNTQLFGINDNNYSVGVSLTETLEPLNGFFWETSQGSVNFTDIIGAGYFPYAGINNLGFSAGEESESMEYHLLGSLTSNHVNALFSTDEFAVFNAINDLNLIMGESDHKAIIYNITSNTLHNLNDFEFTNHKFDSFLRIYDMNEDGYFVGQAWKDGVTHGVTGKVAVVVPEPSTLSMITFGLSDLVVWIFSKDKSEDEVKCFTHSETLRPVFK